MDNEIIKQDENEEVVSYFKKEESELNRTINEIDDLYSEIKKHYDNIKQASRSANGGRGVLGFVEKQTGNLVSLKNAKASLINSKITMKKYEAELALKQKKDQNENNVSNDLINAIMSKLDDKEGDSIIVDSEDYSSDDNIDDILEKRINTLEDSGEITFNNEIQHTENIVLGVYVHNKKWKFVGIDETNQIVKDFEVPDKKGFKMKLHKQENGSYIATDQNDKMYKVIKKK